MLPRRLASFLVLLLASLPLAGQFAIPPAGVGTGIRAIGAFDTVQLPSGPHVVWTSKPLYDTRPDSLETSSTWAVPLTEELEPGLPVHVPDSIAPADGVWVGDALVAAAECTSPARSRSVCLRRFDRTGRMVESILVEEGAHSPRIASTGTEALFVFVEDSIRRQVIAVAVGQDGALGHRTSLGMWEQSANGPSLAASRGSFFVALNGIFRLQEIRGGEIVRTVPLGEAAVGSERIRSVDLAGSDEGLLILARVWNDGAGFIRAKHLDAGGPWVDLSPVISLLGRAQALAVSGGWIVGWSDSQSPLRARRFGFDETLGPVAEVAAVHEVASLYPVPFDLAADGAGGAIVLFPSFAAAGPLSDPPQDLRMRTLDANAQPRGAAKIVSLATAPQVLPDSEWDGAGFLVVWNERDRDGVWRVAGARLGADGEILRRIAVPFRGKDQLHPAISFNGESHLVVWSEGPSGVDRVVGARFSAEGDLLDSAPLLLFGAGATIGDSRVQPAARTAHVDWSGTDWIVVTSSADHEIVGRRVSGSGFPLTPPVTLVPMSDTPLDEVRGNHRNPVIACGDESCLLAWRKPILWSCNFTCPVWPDAVLAARLTFDLTVRPIQQGALDPLDQVTLLSPRAAGARSGRGLDIAWNESARAWMVAWDSGLSGRRIEADGSWLDVESQGGGSTVAVVPEGEGWRVASLDSRFFAGESERFFVQGFVDGSFSGIGSLRDQRTLWPGKVRVQGSWPSIRIVEAPRPLALISIPDAATGQDSLFGHFLDERHERRRSVGRR